MGRTKKATGDILYFDLDLSRIGLGRVTKSARTRELNVYNKRKGVLETLKNAGKLDILRAWAEDQISIEQLHSLNEEQRLFEAMELILYGRNLWDSFADTIDRMGSSELTRRRYQTSIEKLRRIGEKDAFKKRLGPGATVGDLEKVDWDELKKQWGGSPSDWNHMHRMLSHFLSKLVGKKSQHRYRIIELVSRKKESRRVVDLTIAQFFRLRDALPERLRPVLMTLLLTGMRRTEYMAAGKEHLHPESHSVMIPQTAADSSTEPVYVDESLWHWIEAAIPSPLKYKWLRIHWKRACETAGLPGLRFHDMRHVLGHWALKAGAPINEVQAALRHDRLETTAIYLRTKAKKNIAKVMGEVVSAGERGRGSRRRSASRSTKSSRRSRRKSAVGRRRLKSP